MDEEREGKMDITSWIFIGVFTVFTLASAGVLFHEPVLYIRDNHNNKNFLYWLSIFSIIFISLLVVFGYAFVVILFQDVG